MRPNGSYIKKRKKKKKKKSTFFFTQKKKEKEKGGTYRSFLGPECDVGRRAQGSIDVIEINVENKAVSCTNGYIALIGHIGGR
jgi:hypothetical protein